jgi:hypothetical protein
MIRKLPKKQKRSTRFRSQRHCSHIRQHACAACDADSPIEVAHYRLGSGAGMGQRPHDWSAAPLCRDCHSLQHSRGERTFWQEAGKDPLAVIEALIRTSPVRAEIEAHRRSDAT